MPTLTLFAGPNGSGKSTIVNYILKDNPYPYPPGTYYLNADDLERQLRNRPSCDLRTYQLQALSLTEWNQFVIASTLTIKICAVKQITVDDLLDCIKLVRGSIIIKTVLLEPDSYIAALIIDFIRNALIQTGQSFAFETVMSHPDKLDIMQRAKEAGFMVRLYYVTTRDPDINVARVKNRVKLGGHPVDKSKIRSRYFGSLDNLADALRLADEAYLFDNSTDGQSRIDASSIEVAHKNGTDLMVTADEVPEWYTTYVENKFLNADEQ